MNQTDCPHVSRASPGTESGDTAQWLVACDPPVELDVLNDGRRPTIGSGLDRRPAKGMLAAPA